jgi:CBS domain-containing protein
MSLINSSHHPPITANPEWTVMQACELMLEHGVGAVAVLDPDGKLRGIFTERDVMRKVVAKRLNPDTTPLREVMTSPCFTLPNDRTPNDALNLMVAMKINHLALVGENNELIGMLSYRTLLSQKVDNLNAEVDHLSAYIGSDGIGGD